MSKFDLSRTIAKNLGVKTSLEDFDVDVNIGTTETEVDENGAQLSPVTSSGELTPEAAEVEVTEEVQETEELDEQGEELEEDVETLESLKLVLEKSLSQGGLDTVSAEMFNITLNTVLGKHGIKTTDVVPSMEDFGDNRYHSTQVSMEKVGDALKSFGQGVKNVLKQIWQQVKKLVFTIVQAFKGGLVKRADALLAKAKTAEKEGWTPKEKQIKLYAASKLENEGKIANPSVLGENYVKYVNVYKNMTTSYKELAERGIDEVINKFNNSVNIAETWGNLVKTELVEDIKETGFGRFKSEKVTVSAPLYFGNAAVELNTENGKVKLVKENKLSRANEGESQMADVLALKDIMQICEVVVKVKDILSTLEGVYNNKALEKKITEIAEAKTKAGMPPEEGKQAGALTPEQAAGMFRSFVSFGGQMASHLGGVNKAMLDYAAQSLNNYGKPKDAK